MTAQAEIPFRVSVYGHLAIDLTRQADMDGAVGSFSAEEREFANEAFAVWRAVVQNLVDMVEAAIARELALTSPPDSPYATDTVLVAEYRMALAQATKMQGE